ncbi:hypothetical protein BDD14_1645 [Edaphobacter modestus]|uniref:Uncharacterized protein n=1 Tax=Edaphobacter modestus TaxID=388466 RepID=A0A4V2G4A3_9BACT|nr:hypothetical protein BDD14_1645 [Edaphobacter modestus]
MAKSKMKRKRAPKSVLKLPDLEQSKFAVLNSLSSICSQRTYDHFLSEAPNGSHASSTTSYTAKNPTQRQSSTTAMNKNSNEPKCAFANTPHYSASNSYPSQQIQQLSKLVPEESAFDQVRVGASLGRVNLAKTPYCGRFARHFSYGMFTQLLPGGGQAFAMRYKVVGGSQLTFASYFSLRNESWTRHKARQ